MGIFAGLAALGKIGDAIDRITRFAEKIWDKMQWERAKKEVREEAVKDLNLRTYEQLDKADALQADLFEKTREEVKSEVEKSRLP